MLTKGAWSGRSVKSRRVSTTRRGLPVFSWFHDIYMVMYILIAKICCVSSSRIPVLFMAFRRTYGCAYCSSHTAVMGTVWGGSGLTLDKNAQAMDAEPNVEIFTSKELAAINIAKKVK